MLEEIKRVLNCSFYSGWGGTLIVCSFDIYLLIENVDILCLLAHKTY